MGGIPRMEMGSNLRSFSSVATESGCGSAVLTVRYFVATGATSTGVMLNSLPMNPDYGTRRQGATRGGMRCGTFVMQQRIDVFAKDIYCYFPSSFTATGRSRILSSANGVTPAMGSLTSSAFLS